MSDRPGPPRHKEPPPETPTPAVSRAPWGSVTRERVIETALEAVRAGRYEEMTIRSLAADMGVSPMSLYGHVRSKEDILDEVVDRLLSRAWQPHSDPQDWEAWVTEAAGKFRRFLVRQPAALHVYLRHPIASPAAMKRMEAMLKVLRSGLGDDSVAEHAYAAVHTYTIGFAALEASRAASNTSEDEPSRKAARLAFYASSEQFAEGLRYLLMGIAASLQLVAAQRRTSRRDGPR